MGRRSPFFSLYHYSIRTKSELKDLLKVDEAELNSLLFSKNPKFTHDQLIALAKTFRTSVWFLKFIFNKHTGVYWVLNILADFTINCLLFFRP